MKNPYDIAHELARALKESDEYREYTALKEAAYADQTNRSLLDEYKRLQFRLQASAVSGASPDDGDMERFRQIATLLQFNEDAGKYLVSEFRYQKMLSDIYKILADTAGIDLDTLMSGR